MSILKTQFSFTNRKISSKDLSKRPFRISASASGRLLSQAYGERQKNPYISKDIRKKIGPTKKIETNGKSNMVTLYIPAGQAANRGQRSSCTPCRCVTQWRVKRYQCCEVQR